MSNIECSKSPKSQLELVLKTLCGNLSGLCVEPIFTAKFAKVNAKAVKKRAKQKEMVKSQVNIDRHGAWDVGFGTRD